jgi:pyruvate,orthophosphate dikinase
MGTSQRWVYCFGNGRADGRGDQKELLGGKGAGLAEMTRIGLPVPGGFTITTEACPDYKKKRGKCPKDLETQVRRMLAKLERASRKRFGAARDPLFVSVRSGAARSMPGMMDTILNLGLNNESVQGLTQTALLHAKTGLDRSATRGNNDIGRLFFCG